MEKMAAAEEKANWMNAFLSPFYTLNQDLLEKIPLDQVFEEEPGLTNLAELVVVGIRKASLAAAVFSRLVLQLRSHRSHGVLYIADEHNGIFKYNRQKDYPFREFTSFTAGLVDGSVRIVVMWLQVLICCNRTEPILLCLAQHTWRLRTTSPQVKSVDCASFAHPQRRSLLHC